MLNVSYLPLAIGPRQTGAPRPAASATGVAGFVALVDDHDLDLRQVDAVPGVVRDDSGGVRLSGGASGSVRGGVAAGAGRAERRW